MQDGGAGTVVELLPARRTLVDIPRRDVRDHEIESLVVEPAFPVPIGRRLVLDLG